jgi:transcriptional regulator with XRE-family HTH domain
MEAAREIGVSQTLVSTLERGPHKGMRVDELFRLLAFYGITPNQVAILLGYATDDEQASAISDPHLRSLVQSLEHLPDDVTDAIVRALDLMVRGAHG